MAKRTFQRTDTNDAALGGRAVWRPCKPKVAVLSPKTSDMRRQISPANPMNAPTAKMWALTFDAVSDLIAILDPEYRILRMNRSMAERLGIQAGTAVGKRCYEIVHRRGAPPAVCPHRRMLETGEGSRSEVFDPRLDGWFEVSVVPLRDDDGRLVGSIHAAREITARKQAEERLQESRGLLENGVLKRTAELNRVNLNLRNEIDQRLAIEAALEHSERQKSAILDAIREQVVFHDMEQRIIWANRAAAESVNIAAAKMTGRKCYDFWGDGGKICPECPIAKVLQDGGPHEAERELPDGRMMLIYGYPFYDENNGLSGAVEVTLDITEKVRMDEQLTRAARLSSLGQLAGGIAHEIRNPLTGIRLFMDILADPQRFAVSTQQREIIDDITENVVKIEGIIRRVLDLAKAKESAHRPVAINDLIRKTLMLWNSRINKFRIRLNLQLDEGVASVLGDDIEIQQVITNLVSNALDAMDSGGELTIASQAGRSRFHPDRPMIIITVSDTGPGIPEAQQPDVFNPFFTTKASGTGLGLAISHKIIARHGGVISLENRVEGGVRVCIELPAAGDQT